MSTALSVLPVGKIFKIGADIAKGFMRGLRAYKSWQRALRVADDVIAKAEKLLNDAAGLCKTHSFDPRTPVLMADGSRKPIKDVRVGDKVKATNPDTDKLEEKSVTQLHLNRDSDLVDLTVRTAAGATSTLHTTVHHPFWNETTHEWADAAVLRAGDRLRAVDGVEVTVQEVRVYTGSQDMNDLTVADVHTYYVIAGTTPVLVHNCTISPYELNRTEALSGSRSAKKVDDIAKSMKQDGWQGDPIEVYEHEGSKYVINGHHRVAAAKRAGIDVEYRSIPLEEAQAYGYADADAIVSAWSEVGPDRIGRRR